MKSKAFLFSLFLALSFTLTSASAQSTTPVGSTSTTVRTTCNIDSCTTVTTVMILMDLGGGILMWLPLSVTTVVVYHYRTLER